MRKFSFLITLLTILTLTCNCFSQAIDGTWSGKLYLGNNHSLKIVLHISRADTTVTMDSSDQGTYGIESQVIRLTDDSVSFRIPSLMVNYDGKLNDGKIDGTFIQGNAKIPLTLTYGADKALRPQTPQPPFPYSTEEINIENRAGGSVLAGTLTVPADCSSSTPIAVLVSGSGYQNRDEELFEHKPFAVIADYLARNGIASLRYDDRGFGQSTGDVESATTADFAGDTRAIINWLRDQRRFGKVGIIGHSEGGQIAYMLGAESHGPDFIVSIAGPVIKGSKTIAYQNKVALLSSGIDEQTAEEFASALEKVFEYKLANPEEALTNADKIVNSLYQVHTGNPMTAQLAASLRAVLTAPPTNLWMVYFLGYDPAADIRALNIPALIIFGEKDRQVPPSLNADEARKLCPTAEVITYPDLNHMMQHSVTGAVEEYSTIEETISPEVLARIVSFISE